MIFFRTFTLKSFLYFILIHTLIRSDAQNCLPDENNHRWIIADIAPTGLSNMLFGVYSYIPVALLYNATGVIIGPMYSRRNFEQHYRNYQEFNHVALPFSYFFDINIFKSFWKKSHNLTIVELHEYKHCLNLTKFVNVKRRDFFAQSDMKLLSYLNLSNIAVPIPLSLRYLKLDYKLKYIGLYQFWQNQKTVNLFKAVHSSMKINETIKNVINIINSHLPKKYYSVHIRLEPDKYYEYSHVLFRTKSFNDTFPYHMKFIARSNCLRSYFLYKNTTIFNYSESAINEIPLYKNKQFP